MRLRYMLEYVLRDKDTKPRYEPIGVWVQGPGPGLDIVMEFLPGNDEAQEEADWVINRLVENGIKSLPEDFLEYHRATMSPYSGMRGEIVEIRTSAPRKAAQALRGRLAADSVGLFGDRVHVTTANPDSARASAEKILLEAGLKLEGIRPIEPSLEDIFISVLAGGPGGEAHGGS